MTLKLAVSADGMLGRRGEEVSITGLEARAEVHRLRAEADAILVGIGTVLSDDPELTVRIPGLEKRSPVRIVLDRQLQLPMDSKLVRTARDVPVIAVAAPGLASHVESAATPPLPCRASPLKEGDRPAAGSLVPFGIRPRFCDAIAGYRAGRRIPDLPTRGGDARQGRGGDLAPRLAGELSPKVAALQSVGVEIMDATELDILLAILAVRGMSSLLVEGGATVASAFLEANLVDRILLFQGTGLVGEGGLESPLTPSDMPPGFKLVREESFGPDRCFEYERNF